MRPAWSVILLTTLIGAAQGLFLVVLAVDAFRPAPREFVFVSCVVSLVLLGSGLVASFFHLGRPERAWRAASQWRTSWLSREVIVLPAFMGMLAIYALSGSFAAGIIAIRLHREPHRTHCCEGLPLSREPGVDLVPGICQRLFIGSFERIVGSRSPCGLKHLSRNIL